MAFVRRKRGQVLLVHNARSPGEAGVRQRELFRFSSAAELAAALIPAAWRKWTSTVAWKEQDVKFDWEPIREKLASELRQWNGAPSGARHRHGEKVDRLTKELTSELATLSLAGPTDAALVERMQPSLVALREALSRLLPTPRSTVHDFTQKETSMTTVAASHTDSIEELFDEGMEHWWAGERRRALPIFRRVLALDPQHADANNHLGIASLDARKLKPAERYFRAAVEGGARALERDGGRLPWGILENRPYLRGMGNLARARGAPRRWREALAVHVEQLRLNPDDNQGVRYLIGAEYLRIGDIGAAIDAYRSTSTDEPGCAFGLALATLSSRGSHADVGTALLSGFALNRYVAPMLLGESWERLDGFHGTNMAEPEWAQDVVEGQADLWHAVPRGAEVLRLWWRAPSVAAWRKQLDEIVVQLKDVRLSEQRSALASRSIALRSPGTVKALVRTVHALS